MNRAFPPRGARPFAATQPTYPFANRVLKERFLDLVRQRLGRDGASVIVRGGVACVEGSPAMHGLTNLAQVCHQHSTTAWPRLVDEHFDKSETERVAHHVQTAFDDDAGPDLERFGLRIQAADCLPDEILSTIVHRVDLPGTITMLVVDVGESVMPVPTLFADEWGFAVEELFARAVANLPKLCSARWEVLRVPLDDGIAVDLLGNDFYAAASILRPEPFLPRLGEHGNLIALPSREVLLSWPIEAAVLPRAIEAMVAMARGKFHDGPGSITPHLYWRTPAGEFQLQQDAIDGGRARLAPSPEFAQLLAELLGRGSGG